MIALAVCISLIFCWVLIVGRKDRDFALGTIYVLLVTAWLTASIALITGLVLIFSDFSEITKVYIP